jgi:RNA-directed DNA polymerase
MQSAKLLRHSNAERWSNRWAEPEARFRELRKRGVGKDLAAQTAGSPHGPWRLAISPALSIALSDPYLAELGLPPMVVRH